MRLRYDLVSGAIESWGDNMIPAERKGILDNIDPAIVEYLSVAGHVNPATKSLVIDQGKIDALKNAPSPQVI